MTQDVYMAKRSVDAQAALALGPLHVEGVKGGKSVRNQTPSDSERR